MKNLSIMLILISLVVIVSSCAGGGAGGYPENSGKLKIVATLFPQYDFARQIAGDKADVKLLLPPGMESHTFDPKPGDMTNINSADLFIYTGDEMEPWAEKVVSGISNGSLSVVDCSSGISLDNEGEHDEHDEQELEHGYDPHIWLDPSICLTIVDNITDSLCGKDPQNADYYRKNADNYKQELKRLDDDFFEVIKNAQKDTIVFGGRFSYIHFLKHYGLKYETVYDSCSSQAEPSMAKISHIMNYIKENNITCIYHEEFVVPKVANSIAEQMGIEVLLFSTVHNLSKDEIESGVTYIDIMRDNLESLKKGLGVVDK